MEARRKELDRDADPAKSDGVAEQAREKWERTEAGIETASPRRWHLLASKRLKS